MLQFSPQLDPKQGYKASRGNIIAMASGILLSGMVLGAFSVDLPHYFTAQNQMQTAVNSAALAGANELANSTASTDEQVQAAAEATALEYAQMNKVDGKTLESSDLEFFYPEANQMSMEVVGHKSIDTLFAKLLCMMHLNQFDAETEESGNGEEGAQEGCDVMTVTARAKAVPAARDTMIVIDNSSSMKSISTTSGNERPLKDVKQAAKAYVDKVKNINSEAVDRIGFLRFAYDTEAVPLKGLKTAAQSNNFQDIKNSIDGVGIYNAQGWNTNYEAPLKVALDELITNGRKNATKNVLFMTDGMPNLPAPASYYSYSKYQPYNKCIKIVDDYIKNTTSVKTAICTKNSKGQWVCPTLPSSKIKDSMIPQTAVDCGKAYTDYMVSSVKAQVDRAVAHEITIHTIVIYDGQEDNATQILRRLRKEPNWDPALIEYMNEQTEGWEYEAPNYDAAGIEDIYEEIAKKVRLRLAS